MLDIIYEVNGVVNGIVWGLPIIFLILFTGIFFSFRLGFPQFRHAGFLFWSTVKKAFSKRDEDDKQPGEISSFQAAMISVSAIVGSGNIAGVATAIVLGGPGAVFWMIIAAVIGMTSKFAEIALGIKYREINPDGSISGGAMYYIAKGLGQKWLGTIFAIIVIIVYFIIGAIVDTNTIALAVEAKFGLNPLICGFILAVAVAIVIFGGISRVGRVCELLSPFMAGSYILAGLAIILLNISDVPAAIGQIVQGAFSPAGVTGGAVGSMFMCMRYGFARGMFSNEAGMGTAAMVHSNAKVESAGEQACWGPVEVFLDTVLVCSISSLAIVLSGLWDTGLDGAELTMAAFDKMLPGGVGGWICLGSVILFGYSCLITVFNYAERAGEFVFGPGCKKIIRPLWIITIVIGSQTTLGFAWDLADTFNGIMVFINLVAILLLSKEVVQLKNEYWDKAMPEYKKNKKK